MCPVTLFVRKIRNSMDYTGRRLLTYLRPGFLIEYDAGLVKHLALVLEIDPYAKIWLDRDPCVIIVSRAPDGVCERHYGGPRV